MTTIWLNVSQSPGSPNICLTKLSQPIGNYIKVPPIPGDHLWDKGVVYIKTVIKIWNKKYGSISLPPNWDFDCTKQLNPTTLMVYGKCIHHVRDVLFCPNTGKWYQRSQQTRSTKIVNTKTVSAL